MDMDLKAKLLELPIGFQGILLLSRPHWNSEMVESLRGLDLGKGTKIQIVLVDDVESAKLFSNMGPMGPEEG